LFQRLEKRADADLPSLPWTAWGSGTPHRFASPARSAISTAASAEPDLPEISGARRRRSPVPGTHFHCPFMAHRITTYMVRSSGEAGISYSTRILHMWPTGI